MLCLSSEIIPVSYTHLDVYKRQENKAVEKMVATESEKQPSSGRKNGCAGVGNVENFGLEEMEFQMAI